MSDFISVT